MTELSSQHMCSSTSCFQGSFTAVLVVRQDSTLTMANNCFRNNKFAGPGTVSLSSSVSLTDASGNFVSLSTDSDAAPLICPFIATASTNGSDTGVDCREATGELDVCETLEAAAPPRADRSGYQTQPASDSSHTNQAQANQYSTMLLWSTLLPLVNYFLP